MVSNAAVLINESNIANKNKIPACCITFSDFWQEKLKINYFCPKNNLLPVYTVQYVMVSGMKSDESLQKYMIICTIV